MTTLCSTDFYFNGALIASIYRHHDGYPDSNGRDLIAFLDEIERQNAEPGPYQGRFFESPGEVSAWWIAYLSRDKFGVRDFKHFDVEICSDHTHGDIEYRYEVLLERSQRPKIRVFQRHVNNHTLQWQWLKLTDDLKESEL